MQNYKLLVIIVTYNAMKWVDRCFQSVLNSSIKADLFVVDNGSNDGTIDYVKSHYANIKLTESSTNLGFGRANNLGINYAIEHDYDFVYLLNQDAWVFEDTFEIIINNYSKNTSYGILTPLQIEANEQNIDKNFAYNLSIWPYSREVFNKLLDSVKDGVVEVVFEMAAHWMVSRSCFLKVGLFSPSFPHYGEDNNYVCRVKYHGFKIGVVPSAKAVHDREYRVDSIEKKIYIDYISAIIDLSDIQAPNPRALLINLLSLLSRTIKYRSFLPLKYAWKLIFSLGTLKKNKLETKSEGAFINL